MHVRVNSDTTQRPYLPLDEDLPGLECQDNDLVPEDQRHGVRLLSDRPTQLFSNLLIDWVKTFWKGSIISAT